MGGVRVATELVTLDDFNTIPSRAPVVATDISESVRVVPVPEALAQLETTLDRTFPTIKEETKACCAVAATLLLDDQVNPVALNWEGVPSSVKTTMLSFFDGAKDQVYKTDKFTPKSFVSHSANTRRADLDKIDLLPRIKHRVFLVPELAPIFGLRADDLLETFSILTRILDGQGFWSDSGVQGRRGYSGDYYFAWIGCTTPIPHRVWKTMSTLGSRFLFMEMPDGDKPLDDLVDDLLAPTSFPERVAACREAVTTLVASMWAENGGVRGVHWERNQDPRDVVRVIGRYAQLLARLRGTISVWREESGDHETHNFSTPVIEQPHRAMSLLYALARGHALIHGRRQLTEADLPIVARAALESTPHDRRAVMRLLIEDENGVVSAAEVEKAIHCSRPTARAIMETLGRLQIGVFDNPDPPEPATLTLAEDLRCDRA